MALSYYQLFELFLKSDSTENFIIAVTKELNCKNIREHENTLKRFYSNLRKKWIAKHRFRNRFIEKLYIRQKWLLCLKTLMIGS